MTSYDLNFGARAKLGLKNRILESCSQTLKRDLTPSALLKSSFLLQTSNTSLENKIITASELKRKCSSDDICPKRAALSHTLSFYNKQDSQDSSITHSHQKEDSHLQRSLPSEVALKVEGYTTAEDKSSKPLPAAHQMPHYVFSPLKFDDVPQDKFNTAKDKLLDYMNEKKKEEQLLKDEFLTLVSASLMYSPNFRDFNSDFCKLLLTKTEEVAEQYPEFILKVALYTRQELNIRTTANFLLAYAAYNVKSRYYLKQYFSASICLPSDWMEVAEICKKLSEERGASFPSALRKAMVKAFSKFDDYQLAKYNRDPIKNMKRKQRRHLKQKTKENVALKQITLDDKEDVISRRQVYTLKKLIKVLHVTKPVEHVMCILGKKYPIDIESFQKSKLPGNWNKERAGKRMKLPVPETWETEVSAHGNKAAVWENLIDKKKLPYMAMLRNIRNLVITGISMKHHRQVLKKLCDEKAVMKSRQFPLRFFSAYGAIHGLETITSKKENITYLVPKRGVPTWKKKLKERLEKRANNIDAALLKEYRVAVDRAVEISCRNNIAPIKGKTLVICDVLSCSKSECQSLKGSVVSKMYEACILLGMMISCVAEECEVILTDKEWSTVDMKDGSILDNVLRVSNEQHWFEDVDHAVQDGLPLFLDRKLCAAVEHIQLDQIVLLTSGKDSNTIAVDKVMLDFTKKYRIKSNKHLLYLKVDLTGNQKSGIKTTSPYDVALCGFSDQVLRFMSERGNCRQLEYVENIDKKYELKPMPKARPVQDDKKKILQSAVISNEMQRWRTVRVFISSTFRDMHGERDLIVRYIMPELRARAKTLCVNIHEVDLRWGITEEESSTNKATEICLAEASSCEYFIGILGERYGNVFDYNMTDDPEFQWLKEHPPGASITELEIYCAALSNPTTAANNSFFYFRDKSFMKTIPEVWKDDFLEKSEHNIEKLKALKEKIKYSGLEVFENYPCTWGGAVNGVPLVGGLEEFGERVLQNLWNALCKEYKKDLSPFVEQKISTLHTKYSEEFQLIIGQVDLIQRCVSSIKNNDGIFLITGKSGCGKTALMRMLSRENMFQPTFPYFFGINSRSCYLHNMLKDLIFSLISYFNLESIPPTDYQNMVNFLPNILEAAIESSLNSTLNIFIDGLDHVMTGADDVLSWLPCTLPKGLKIVIAVSQESVIYTRVSEKLINYKPYFEFVVKPLSLPERQEFVTNRLEPHHKVLDRSPFNNQLLMLTNKRDAGYPLYLHLACEELRTFGIFEKLTPRLQRYPQTFCLLLKEVISQLENFHGKDLLKTALCLLAISPEGLSENELHALLSLTSDVNCLNQPFESVVAQTKSLHPEDLLPPLKFSSLLRTLHGLLEISGTSMGDTLKITHNEILIFVQESYMNRSNSKIAPSLHKLIAAYFYNEIMPKKFGIISKEASVRMFRLLSYHLIESEHNKELCNILCNIGYIKSAIERGLKSELLKHYLLLKQEFLSNIKLKVMVEDRKRLEDYYTFASCNLHILTSYPCLIYQQALNEPDYSFVYKDCSSYPKDGLMHWVTKPHAQTGALCYVTLSVFQQAVVTIAASLDGKIAALGTENGLIQIIDVSTGKLLRTFRGHSEAISSLHFLGNSHLCSASVDCTLSVWNVDKGYRIHILKGHTRHVSSCCFSPCGSHIISVAWDCTMRIWNAKDGQELRSIKITKKPLTCLSHHPHKALVVTGGWDKKLQIWNLIEITKKRVLKGHSASVRSVAFSPCGQTVVSASFSGEIFYWSVALGIQIGKITDRGPSTNCLNFTKSGDLLISGGNENQIKVWSYKRGEIVQEISLNDYKIHCMMFLSLEYIAVGYKNGLCVVFEINTGDEYWRSHHIKDAVTCLEPYCDESSGCLLGCIIASLAGHVTLVKFQGNIQISATIYQETTTATVFKENIIAGTDNGEIFIIPFVTLKPNPIPAHQSAVTKCAVKQDQLITISKDHSMKIWHLEEDNLVLYYALPYCHGDWLTACTYADNLLITGSQDCSIKLWEDETWENKAVLTEMKSPINHLALQGNFVIAGTVDGSIGVWNKKGAFVTSVPPLENHGPIDVVHITKTALLNDKSEVHHYLMASVEENGYLIIRKPFSKILLTALPCQSDPVSSFCVTAEDNIISSSPNNSVQFWKINNNDRRSRQPLVQHKEAITRVEVSSNGKFALSTDKAGKLIVWAISLSSKNPLSYITEKEWKHGAIPSAVFVHFDGYVGIICAVNKLGDGDIIESFAVSLKLIQGKSACLRDMNIYRFSDYDEALSVDSYSKVDEVLSVDSNSKVVSFGMKSGIVFILNKRLELLKFFNVSDNWIIRTFSPDSSEDIYVTGPQEIWKFESYRSKNPVSEIWKDFSDTVTWPNACYMMDKRWYIGTIDGFVHIISRKDSTKQKIHSDAVNDISVCCNFIFTCSEDSTIKVLDATSLRQVGVFYLPLPIKVLSAHQSTSVGKGSNLITIICGTKNGEVHLLTWHGETLSQL